MIDHFESVRRLAACSCPRELQAPLLRWQEGWRCSAGDGVAVGLLDTRIAVHMPDLATADLQRRSFVPDGGSWDSGHGSFSAALLAGQGRSRVRGLAPRARLLCAEVVDGRGVADEGAVCQALDWLLERDAQVIAIPLGDEVERSQVASRLEACADKGVVVFAAAGNVHPDPILFPARHPEAVAVGAVDQRGALLPDCARLPRLDLLAPGTRVGGRASGSSVACVVAAGVAALALAAAGPLRPRGRDGLLKALTEPACCAGRPLPISFNSTGE